MACSAEQTAEEENVGKSVINDPRFRSFVTLPMPAMNQADCLNTRLVLSSGKRPLCAETTWTPAGASGICRPKGTKGGTCRCYEGQAHACDLATGGPCTTGTGCGIKACLVNSDTDAVWSACDTL
jgi:hypothetical protein